MNVSEESKDFLRRSLNTDEEARIGIKEIEVFYFLSKTISNIHYS